MTKPTDLRTLLRLLLAVLWGLAIALVLSAGLWSVLSAAGDEVGRDAARNVTLIVAILAGIDLAAIVVNLARDELN
jgi:hypothetical protein